MNDLANLFLPGDTLNSVEKDWLEIDGSLGEGGGQILRTSLALAILTRRCFRLRRIRAKRPQPGLRPQHLAGVRAAATISQAEVRGDRVGSQELTFAPGDVVADSYHFAIGTAGATGLVLQTVYLPLILSGSASSTLTITGGTHVNHSPCFHYLATTWRSCLSLLGVTVALEMRRPGFYPRGGGIIETHLQPSQHIAPLRIAESEAAHVEVSILSAVAGLPRSIADRQARRAETRLRGRVQLQATNVEEWPGGPGTMLGLVLTGPPVPTFFFGLGARGKPAERVADEAVDDLLAHLEAAPTAFDPHAADQLVLPLALATGASRFPTSRITQHLLTNVAVIRQFLDRQVMCEGSEGEKGWVVVD